MELLVEADLVKEARLAELMKDMNDVVAMIDSSIKTLRSKQIQNPKSKI